MTNIAIYVGPYEVLTTAKAVLETHLPDALAAYSAAHGFDLAEPQDYWLYEDVRRDWQSPGVSLNIPTTVVTNYLGLGGKDVARTLVAAVILRLNDVMDYSADPPIFPDLTYYRQALRDYCDAIAKTLETYMPAATYQDVSLVYRVDVGEPSAQIVTDQTDTGDYVVFAAVEVTVYQRVSARTPYTAPVTP